MKNGGKDEDYLFWVLNGEELVNLIIDLNSSNQPNRIENSDLSKPLWSCHIQNPSLLHLIVTKIQDAVS